jgi:glutamate---cysteine ligase / carboxylate-amine ligase
VADNDEQSSKGHLLALGRAGRAAAQGLAAAPTLGVEEEFLLLDPVSGQVVPAAPELLGRLDGASWAKGELMRFQVEAVTDICTSLGQLRAELATHRRAVAALAEPLGCLLVAAGTTPEGTSGLAHLTPSVRYLELARRSSSLLDGSGTCGCHVHVGVACRELGVQVLNRLRPWLPTLLALSANSPLTGGGESGWASWRHRMQARWPTARPPPVCPTAAAYDAVVAGLIHRRAALDRPNVKFLARLSPRYPTVEVRVADVCLDLDDAVLLAGLVRALVTTAIQEADDGVPVRAAPAGRIQAAVLAAARHGLDGPWSGPLVGGEGRPAQPAGAAPEPCGGHSGPVGGRPGGRRAGGPARPARAGRGPSAGHAGQRRLRGRVGRSARRRHPRRLRRPLRVVLSCAPGPFEGHSGGNRSGCLLTSGAGR